MKINRPTGGVSLLNVERDRFLPQIKIIFVLLKKGSGVANIVVTSHVKLFITSHLAKQECTKRRNLSILLNQNSYPEQETKL